MESPKIIKKLSSSSTKDFKPMLETGDSDINPLTLENEEGKGENDSFVHRRIQSDSNVMDKVKFSKRVPRKMRKDFFVKNFLFAKKQTSSRVITKIGAIDEEPA